MVTLSLMLEACCCWRRKPPEPQLLVAPPVAFETLPESDLRVFAKTPSVASWMLPLPFRAEPTTTSSSPSDFWSSSTPSTPCPGIAASSTSAGSPLSLTTRSPWAPSSSAGAFDSPDEQHPLALHRCGTPWRSSATLPLRPENFIHYSGAQSGQLRGIWRMKRDASTGPSAVDSVLAALAETKESASAPAWCTLPRPPAVDVTRWTPSNPTPGSTTCSSRRPLSSLHRRRLVGVIRRCDTPHCSRGFGFLRCAEVGDVDIFFSAKDFDGERSSISAGLEVDFLFLVPATGRHFATHLRPRAVDA